MTARLDKFSTGIEQAVPRTDGKSAWIFKRTLTTQSSFGGSEPDMKFGAFDENYLHLSPSAGFLPDFDDRYVGSSGDWDRTLGPLGATVTWTGASRNTNKMASLAASFVPAVIVIGSTSGLDIHLLDLETYNYTLDYRSC